MSPHTDTSEKGLEALIVRALTGLVPPPPPTGGEAVERPAAWDAGWLLGDASEYDREYCVDLVQLRAFLLATQPKAAEALELDKDGPVRRKALARI